MQGLSELKLEMRMFKRAMDAIAAFNGGGMPPEGLDSAETREAWLDELDVLRMHTMSARLNARCVSALRLNGFQFNDEDCIPVDAY